MIREMASVNGVSVNADRPEAGNSVSAIGVHRKVKAVYFLDGDKFKARSVYRPRQGGNGFGLSDKNVSGTITVVDRHMVAIVR